MKLNANMLVVVAMMAGAVGASGCKSEDKISDKGNDVAAAVSTAAAPEDNPEAAPVSEENVSTVPGVEKDAVRFTYWAGHAPPALRIEERGVAPGVGYSWRPGYYGWGGRDYAWHGGRWYAPRAGYEYVHPSWHAYNGRYGYRPGRWYRR